MRVLSTLAGFNGELIRPGDAGYDQASSADAAVALAHALKTGAPVTVRGGGHNVGGWALADGGVAIDSGECLQRRRPAAPPTDPS